MKRICFLILTVIVLTGCSNGAMRDPLCYQNYPFSVEGELSWMGCVYGVKLEMREIHKGTLTFTSPANIAGTVMRHTPEGCVITRGNLSYSLSEDRERLTPLFALTEAYSLEERSPLHYTENGFTIGDLTFVCDGRGCPTAVSGRDFVFRTTLYSGVGGSA